MNVRVFCIYFCCMQDTYKHKGMRKQLIDQLRSKGITDERVLTAFDQVPRHFFLDLVFDNQAYSNVAFQIGAGQTISHPYTVAFQTSLLNLTRGEKVLEIGTGSGFQTCILCALGVKVFSIERQKELHIKAKKIIDHFGFTPKLFFGDGYEGKETFAPFDKILVTCGAPFIPQKLVQQLKIGGVMIIPVGDLDSQEMHKITKISDTEYKEEVYGNFSFVPMLEKTVK
jgi:protein-L-isoaspartate(D-aspartate) O-methyltransferase